MSTVRVPADNGKAMAWGLAYTLAGFYAALVVCIGVVSDIPTGLMVVPLLFGANWFAKKLRKIEDESNN